jgi:hypothetical protein
MFKIYFKLFTLLFVFLLAYQPNQAVCKEPLPIPMSAYNNYMEVDPNIQELTNAIKSAPPIKQEQWFSRYLIANIPINLPGYWKLVKDPVQALFFLRYFSEPYSPNILDMLESVLPQASNKDELRIASILYRYNRPIGYTVLSNELDRELDADANTQAAIVFTLNKDVKKLPQILKIASTSQDLRYTPSLIRELSSWHDAQVASVLYTLFQQQPKRSDLALALADQNYQEARPLIRKLYFSAPVNKPTKVNAAVALVKLDGIRAKQIFNFLTVDLTTPKKGNDTSVLRAIAFQDFGYLKIDASTPWLKKAITHFLSDKISTSQPDPNQLVDPIELAVVASESLAEIDDKTSGNLIANLLQSMIQRRSESSYIFRVANSLLLLGVSQERLRKLMGEKWIQRKQIEYQLKPIPSYLLSW